jgi:protein-tyrosine phosphatase
MATVSSSILPGTFNARDLGGLTGPGRTVRPGALIRADAPSDLGEDGRGGVRRLGIRTAIDLREPIEIEQRPAELDGLGIKLTNVPILGTVAVSRDFTLEQIYMMILETRGAALAEAIGLIAAGDSTPVLVFCSAGKDRTGLVSALTLSAVGVSDEEIIADYHRTEANVQGAFRERITQRAIAAGLSEQQMAVGLGAPAELMRLVLAWLREHHGGAAGYLLEHGLSDAELEALKRRLLQLH